ncbi:unnamed protein product, partial [Symbiodinium sp. KB8]
MLSRLSPVNRVAKDVAAMWPFARSKLVLAAARFSRCMLGSAAQAKAVQDRSVVVKRESAVFGEAPLSTLATFGNDGGDIPTLALLAHLRAWPLTVPLLVAAATVVARPLRSHDDRLQKLMGPCVGDVDGAPYSGPRVRSSSCVLGVGGNPCWSVAVRGVGDPFTGFRRPGQLPSPQLRKRRQAATEVLRSRAMGRARSRQFGLNQAQEGDGDVCDPCRNVNTFQSMVHSRRLASSAAASLLHGVAPALTAAVSQGFSRFATSGRQLTGGVNIGNAARNETGGSYQKQKCKVGLAMGPITQYYEACWESWPGTARWCMRFTYAQIWGSVLGHLCFHLGPRIFNPSQDEIEIFHTTRYVLIVPIGLLALFHIVEVSKPRPRLRALIMARVSIWEFCIKVTYYSMLSNGTELAWQNMRGYDRRPVYLPRWTGWTFAIPTLLTMNFYPILDDRTFAQGLQRIFPQLACTAAYCWACFVGCVITDAWYGWYLNILGCVAYVAVILDGVVITAERIVHTDQAILKGYSIIVKECVFIIYTCVWLMGCWGYTSSYMCQRFYCDVSLKSTMSF